MQISSFEIRAHVELALTKAIPRKANSTASACSYIVSGIRDQARGAPQWQLQ